MKKILNSTLIRQELLQSSNEEKVAFLQNFFKTHQGGYGEGDIFIGVTVPVQRSVAKKFYKTTSLADVAELLSNPVHELRLTALFMLVYRYNWVKTDDEKESIVELYLKNLKFINNWDLVDSSADKILGAYLFDKDKKLLYKLAKSKSLWEQRVAIISTFYFIRKNIFEDALAISELLLDHKHDLIHKAVGWMLREVGKRNYKQEYDFLLKYYKTMPRTMLRYAIEKFDEELRQKFLKGSI
jgi:3-methyladenine DNA glycosylase AlkD